MTVTLDDIKTWHLRQEVHLDGRGWFGDRKRCIENPRLARYDKYTRATRSVETTWEVDGVAVADLEAAAVALSSPPVLSPAERALLREMPVGREYHASESGYARVVRLRELGVAHYNKETRMYERTALGEELAK